MEIIIIAAMASNRVIGHNNQIPWDIPEDLAHFRQTTMGHTIVMGRKTHTAIGKVLPGRKNIVVTRNNIQTEAIVVHSIEEALARCKNEQKIFIIGGADIFKQALPIANTLILTVLEREVKGDAFFPEYTTAGFIKIKEYNLQAKEPCRVEIYRSHSG